MVVQWRRCGVVADYVAEYLALSFEQPSYAQSVLSTVTNERSEKFFGSITSLLTVVKI
jgi:hypothetical protein